MAAETTLRPFYNLLQARGKGELMWRCVDCVGTEGPMARTYSLSIAVQQGLQHCQR